MQRFTFQATQPGEGGYREISDINNYTTGITQPYFMLFINYIHLTFYTYALASD
jgi:hypothetical protein